jgi:hypothetical protein
MAVARHLITERCHTSARTRTLNRRSGALMARPSWPQEATDLVDLHGSSPGFSGTCERHDRDGQRGGLGVGRLDAAG